MSDARQIQRAGDSSLNVQAHNINFEGITIAEARQIALDVFKANALELAGIARDLFESRGREFIEHFLEQLLQRKPEGLISFADPDFQYALFTAQRDHARSGRQDLEQILGDLLVERSTARDLRRIVLNEAIAAAPKLAEAQLDVLSLVLLFVHDAPLRYEFQNLDQFRDYLGRYVAPFLTEALNRELNFMHLRYTGCVSLDLGGVPFFHRIGRTFPCCFNDGFPPDFETGKLSDLVIPVLHKPPFSGPQPMQLKPMDSWTFDSACRSRGLTEEEIEEWHTVITMKMFSVSKIAEVLRQLEPRFGNLWEAGDNSAVPIEMQLTSVGLALANANVRQKTGLAFDLGQWIA